MFVLRSLKIVQNPYQFCTKCLDIGSFSVVYDQKVNRKEWWANMLSYNEKDQ